MHSRLLQVTGALTLGLLCACVYGPTRQSPESTSRATPVSSDETAASGSSSAIYAEADAALVDGQRALGAWRRGDAASAADGLARARARLAAGARACTRTPDCALERVVDAQNSLLADQSRAMLHTDEAVTAADAGGGQQSPVLTDMPESVRSMNLLKGRELRELITVNEPLRAALREWLTWMRPQLLDAYEHYQYMRYKMWPAYAEAGLPEALLFGILAKESGGKVHAVSSAGASGPLQFMPATGMRYGLGMKAGFDTRFDPAAATKANVAYLNEQFARLNNDIELALAAYNGGEGRLGRLSDLGKRRFSDPRVFRNLAPETRAYVPMVLAAAWLFLHPEEYALRFPQIDIRPGEITLADGMSLNELSICLGQLGNERGWFRTLRNLNPRWDPNERLMAGTRLEVPATAAAAYRGACTDSATVARLHALQDATMPGVQLTARIAGVSRTHIVGKGETLSTIARKLGCNNIKDLASANRIAAPRYAIRAGQKLRIPECRA